MNFKTRWEIVETRKYPESSDISTHWCIRKRWLGLFWRDWCIGEIYDPVADVVFCTFYRNSLDGALEALKNKLGPERFDIEMRSGAISVRKLNPFVLKYKWLFDYTDPTSGNGPLFVVVSGFYETYDEFGNGFGRFWSLETLIQRCETVEELKMKIDLMGLTVDNIKDLDHLSI